MVIAYVRDRFRRLRPISKLACQARALGRPVSIPKSNRES
jgi:hypothetical protein